MSGADALAAPTLAERLEALEALCASAPQRPRRGVNLHLHTNESFSSFRSPSEVVWQAVREGIAVLGINDHYTVAGHEEFRRACGIAGIPVTFSMEAVAMDREAQAAGLLLNDPKNPGRIYLCAKGVTRVPGAGSEATEKLNGLRAALEKRNREMTSKVKAIFRERLSLDGPGWDDVTGLTPANNTTERHVAQAVYLRLKALEGDFSAALEKLCAASPPGDAGLDAVQNFIRAQLLKSGGPCFVPESPEAFLSVEDMRGTFLAFGAIPTYPVLLDPVTQGEADLAGLLEHLENSGFPAVEVIPFRNTRERVSELVAAARQRWWPVFTGTEHNTPQPKPLLDKYTLDPEFEPWFTESAQVLLGHHAECAAGRPGFVDSEGQPAIADPRERFEHFREAGRSVWKG